MREVDKSSCLFLTVVGAYVVRTSGLNNSYCQIKTEYVIERCDL